MNELVKALKNFVVRDIIYIIGGSSVIVSFLYLFNKTDIHGKEIHTAIYILIAGLAYIIGYCIQDTASWIHIVTTASFFKPWRSLIWFYERFLHRKWKPIFSDIEGEDRRNKILERLDQAELIIQEKVSLDNKTERERIISLMHMGTTMGPCSFVSGILLLIKAFVDGNCTFRFNITLAVSVLIISGLMIVLAWIKALELMKNTEGLYNSYKNHRFREYD
ncbi:MAG TPA: hypothetical protein DIU00_15645 [Phycisphaerales bacterium]|nr:hypothetical protein [Phycisphaerales bacterium]